MRLPLLLLMPTVLTYLAGCSARSADINLKQRLRQSVALFDAVDVRSEGDIEGEKIQRMLKANSAKEETDKDLKDERSLEKLREYVKGDSSKRVEEQQHVAEMNAADAAAIAKWAALADEKQHVAEMNAEDAAAIAKWAALAEEKAIMKAKVKDGIDKVMNLDFVNAKLEDLQRSLSELFKEWSAARIEPKPLFEELASRGSYSNARWHHVVDGYLDHLTDEAKLKVRPADMH